MEVPPIAAALDAYARYINDWAKRKGFYDLCPVCMGSGSVYAGPSRLVSGTKPCASCHGSGAVPRNFGELIALMHSELSEALEAHRRQQPDQPPTADEHCPEFSNIEIELADLIIRVLDTAAGMGLRLGAAVEAKMAANERRPHKHGKQY